MATSKHRRWRELSRPEQAVLAGSAVVQIGLAAFAWTDLARRTPDEVNGSKRVWASVIAINYAGPLAYLFFGRRRGTVPFD
ncbi:PLDc N-terminal domain-containing protein [Prauserella muralis]|uniref:Uncharacterized protein n=1 Tax=Prauserella muralis TaxID=588067 RepID=A0A2V4AGF8_9PSEU|nr:PLD nuclease N-terminal domain-containing protein [Prauserella muralis]PXY19022.1 hypothetical protein BAY60_29840 [Prauserella muralis]TWE28915.1 phospholipase D-like protein [Prauserella muralis]